MTRISIEENYWGHASQQKYSWRYKVQLFRTILISKKFDWQTKKIIQKMLKIHQHYHHSIKCLSWQTYRKYGFEFFASLCLNIAHSFFCRRFQFIIICWGVQWGANFPMLFGERRVELSLFFHNFECARPKQSPLFRGEIMLCINMQTKALDTVTHNSELRVLIRSVLSQKGPEEIRYSIRFSSFQQ